MQYYEDFVLNQVAESRPYKVEAKDIIEFASEWDPQPFHTSEEEASKWPFGLFASSVHTYAISMKLCVEMADEPVAALAGLGVDEMRMTAMVKPGDELRARVWIESKRESKTKPDRGITTTRVEMVNQENVMVMTYTNSGLVLKRPAESVCK